MFQFKSENIAWHPVRRAIETSVYDIVEFLQLNEKQKAQTDLPRVLPTDESGPLGSTISSVPVNVDKNSIGRCAYCEGDKATNWHRHRPASRALPDTDGSADDFYLWFAWDKENLLPMCRDCTPENIDFFPVRSSRIRPSRRDLTIWTRSLQRLQEGKRESFTLADFSLPTNLRNGLIRSESPMLHRPGQLRTYGSDYGFDLRTFELYGKSRRAKLTIDHYNLNVSPTLDHRREVIWGRLSDLKQRGHDAEFDFYNLEYGGAWYLTVKSIVTQLLRESGLTGRAYVHGIQVSVKKLYNHKIWGRFDDAVDGMLRDNPTDMMIAKKAKADPVIEKVKAARAQSRRTYRYTRSQPRLTSVAVENYKSLESISLKIGESNVTTDDTAVVSTSQEDATEIDDRVPALLLLGENATGKSSLLEAISIAAVPDDVFSDLRAQAGGILKPSRLILDPEYLGSPDLEKREQAKIALTFETEDGEVYSDTLTIDPEDFSRPRHKDHDNSDHDIMIFAYGAHRLYGARQSDKPSEVKTTIADSPAPVINLFKNDVMLSNPEDWLTQLPQHDLDEVVSALRKVIQVDGDFRDIEVVTDSKGRKYCRINIERPTQNVAEDGPDPDSARIFSTPFTHVSSGYRVVIALICDVLKGVMEQLKELETKGEEGVKPSITLARDLPILVLIDEVEAHLHPRWKLEVISGLRAALPKATFIMSSHDPLCIRGMNNGEVVVFNRIFDAQASGTTTKESVEVIADFPDFQKMTIEQLLTSNLFQLYSPDDSRLEKRFARIIAGLESGEDRAGLTLTREDQEALDGFKASINQALPIGMSEAERVVHLAVAKYLAVRRSSNAEKRQQAHELAIKEIVAALKQVGG